MELNNAERAALNKKMNDPTAHVKCPRCGGEIEFQKIGASALIKCNTAGCIQKSIRGI